VWDDGTAYFPTLAMLEHYRGHATNVIPDDGSEVQFRFCPVSSRAALVQRFESILGAHGLEFMFAWTGYGPPYPTERGACRDRRRRYAATGQPELSCTGQPGVSIHRGHLPRSSNSSRQRVDPSGQRARPGADLAVLATITGAYLERLLVAERAGLS
jgi:hypothetical protein